MNRSILIHNQNTPHSIQSRFDQENIMNFDYLNSGYKSIDEYISKTYIETLKSKKIDLIYIKDNLSSNYLELYGLRVAYHIRLTQELRFIPIIILSDLDGYSLNKLEPMARIIFTKYVFLEPNSPKSIEKFQYKIFTEFGEYNYKTNFLDLIQIDSPENSSNHSIANQWSIDRWADALHVETDDININKEAIENKLYFKYIKALNTQKNSKTTSFDKPTKKGKVLLIDDEWNKGWAEIISQGLKSEYIEFKGLNYEYKNKEFDIASYIRIGISIKQFDPDVVILDLRLAESDQKHDDIDSYSGIKILEKIHEINAGIQVIMLTATSKSTTLEKLYEKKILGYVKKEHPDDISIDTIENINKLVGLVNKGLDRKFLKEVFIIQNAILSLPLFSNLKLSISNDMDNSTRKLFELKNTLLRIFETLDSNIPKPFIYGMLTLYKCIETINDYFIYEKYDVANKKNIGYWFHNNKVIGENGIASVNNKTKSILRHLNIQENDLDRYIDEISCTRNFEIHPGEIRNFCNGRVIRDINETHVLNWFKTIDKILSKMT